MPSNLNERFLLLKIWHSISRACDQYSILSKQYKQLRFRRSMAKRRRNRALFTSLTIRKGCLKEVMVAYYIYILQKTIFYMRIRGGEQ
jgi:hypothetical protein